MSLSFHSTYRKYKQTVGFVSGNPLPKKHFIVTVVVELTTQNDHSVYPVWWQLIATQSDRTVINNYCSSVSTAK